MASGELIFLVWADFVGVARTRGVPVSEYERRRAHGLGWAMAGQALTPFEDIADNPWGSMGEVRQTPADATRLRVCLRPDHPPLHMVLCDSVNPDGSPWECCGRSFLARALADVHAETGLYLKIAYEHEFTLLGADLGWAPPFSLDAVRRIAPFADLCTAALLDAGVGIETFEPEYGVGQYEVSCGPAVGVAGADRVLLAREVIREAARQCALRATFTPKPGPEAVGNGCHVHLSLWDERGRPAAFDANGPGELSAVAASFVAGVRRHLAALCALTAPSPVSFTCASVRTTGAAAMTQSACRTARPPFGSARRRSPTPLPAVTHSTSNAGSPTPRPTPTSQLAPSCAQVSKAFAPDYPHQCC